MVRAGVKISSVLEDYLETIAFLKANKGVVGVSDIAEVLGVKKPSVHNALKSLASKGLVAHEKYGKVSLTGMGLEAASELQGKEDILYRFFTDYLFMEKGLAKEEACRLEHSVSKATIEKLVGLFEFIGSEIVKGKGGGMRKLELYMKKKRSSEK